MCCEEKKRGEINSSAAEATAVAKRTATTTLMGKLYNTAVAKRTATTTLMGWNDKCSAVVQMTLLFGSIDRDRKVSETSLRLDDAGIN